MGSRKSLILLKSLVYSDGRVCISILHAPGDDPMGYESSAERWSPVQSVEKILLSVVSMLAGVFNKWASFFICVKIVLQNQMTKVGQMWMLLRCGEKTEPNSTG